MNLKGIPEYAEHTLSVVTVYCDDTEIRVFWKRGEIIWLTFIQTNQKYQAI
jgi:hypothetical protein